MATGDITTVDIGSTIPLAYGFVRATGQKMIDWTTSDGTIVQAYGLAEGEWDGIDVQYINNQVMAEAFVKGANFSWSGGGVTLPGTANLHFHPGIDTPVGTPFNPTSTGQGLTYFNVLPGDQLLDEMWTLIPDVINRLMYSRLAYYFISFKPTSTTSSTTLTPIGDYRTMKCRIFNADGAQTGYGFTRNPAWQFADSWIRRVIKPEYTITSAGIQQLSSAEAACFDWQSIVECAQYFDQLLANGKPRFCGDYAFASTSTLASIHEQMLLNCRSYQQEYAGKISLICDKPRASVFLFDERHLIPGTFKVDQQDVHSAANRFVSSFNDLDIPIAATIASISRTTGTTGTSIGVTTAVVTTTESNPAGDGDLFYTEGCADDSFNGQYLVQSTDPTNNAVTAISSTYVEQPDGTASGSPLGYFGYSQGRFAQRTPEINHRQAQLSAGQITSSMTENSTRYSRNKVEYDFANMSYDQQNRILKYEAIRALGVDAAPWKPPVTINLSAWLESVDDLDRILKFLQCGDCLDLTDRVSWEWAGKYEIQEMDFNFFNFAQTDSQPGTASGGTLDLILRTMTDDRFVDVSDAPTASYATLPNDALWAGSGVANTAYQVKFDSLVAADEGTSVTITITNLQIGVGPGGTFRNYTDTVLTNQLYEVNLYLFIDDPNATGGDQPLQATYHTADLTAVTGRLYIAAVTTPAQGDPTTTAPPGGGGNLPDPTGNMPINQG